MFGFGKDDETIAHPALQHFDSGAERVKFVVKNTIKKAAKWALVGMLVIGGLHAIGAAAVAMPIISTIAGWFGVTSGSTLMAGAVSGITLGAVGGALVGALSGIVDSDDAVAEAQERRMLNYDRAAQRQRSDQMYAMQMQRQMGGGGMAMGYSPTPGMPQQGMGGPGYERS